jgi:hypothetical protein
MYLLTKPLLFNKTYIYIFKLNFYLLEKKFKLFFVKCRNPNFMLMTKVRACKVVGQKWARESHFMISGVQKNVREWTFALSNELSFWELKSQWIPKFSESNFKDQITLIWEILYIIRKLLEQDV